VFVTPLVSWCFYCPSSQSCQVIDVAQTEGIKPKRKERERERTLILHRYHVGYTRTAMIGRTAEDQNLLLFDTRKWNALVSRAGYYYDRTESPAPAAITTTQWVHLAPGCHHKYKTPSPSQPASEKANFFGGFFCSGLTVIFNQKGAESSRASAVASARRSTGHVCSCR
jgi:hypothetical protein